MRRITVRSTRKDRKSDRSTGEHAGKGRAWNLGKGKGVYQTKKGHIRYNSSKTNGHNARKYVHRVVAESQLGRPLLFISPNHPLNEVVHHLDFLEWHNCTHNLLICPKAIHDFMTLDHRHNFNRIIQENWKREQATKDEPPDWVTGSSTDEPEERAGESDGDLGTDDC